MPRPPARLANCYVPLPLPTPLPSTKVDDSVSNPLFRSSIRGSRVNDNNTDDNNDIDNRRSPHSLRRLCLEISVVTNQLGSSLIEIGHTKVLCEVSLSTAMDSLSTTMTNPNMEEGTLQCHVQFAPNVGMNVVSQLSQCATPLVDSSQAGMSLGKLHSETISLESDLSFQLSSAMVPSIRLENYPKCSLRVDCLILQDDGSVLSACITAASMALADARVELYDLVSSCTVAVVPSSSPSISKATSSASTSLSRECSRLDSGNIDSKVSPTFTCLADPTRGELEQCQAEICLAMLPNHKEVTLWNQVGKLSPSISNEAMELCRDGCRTMHKFMRERFIHV